MIEDILSVQEEDWGLYLTHKEGVVIDNNNVLTIMGQIIDWPSVKGKPGWL